MTRRLLWITGLILTLASPAVAQTSGSQPAITQPQEGVEGTMPQEAPSSAVAPSGQGEILVEEGPTDIRAEKLIGMDITSPQGEKLATVRDVIIDQNGRITGLVVSTGGFLGFGAKPVGLSWESVSVIEAPNSENEITTDLSKDQLAAAPTFKTKEARRDEMLDMQPQLPQGLPPSPQPNPTPPAAD